MLAFLVTPSAYYFSNLVIFGLLLCNDVQNAIMERELWEQIISWVCIYVCVRESGRFAKLFLLEDLIIAQQTPGVGYQGKCFISWVTAHPLNMLKSPVTHIPKARQEQIRKCILPH